MVELVDTLVLGTSAARREGSSPFPCTSLRSKSYGRQATAIRKWSCPPKSDKTKEGFLLRHKFLFLIKARFALRFYSAIGQIGLLLIRVYPGIQVDNKTTGIPACAGKVARGDRELAFFCIVSLLLHCHSEALRAKALLLFNLKILSDWFSRGFSPSAQNNSGFCWTKKELKKIPHAR